MRLLRNPEHFYFVKISSEMLTLTFPGERENIRKRQTEGIAAAKTRGVRFGRPTKKPPENFVTLVKKWENSHFVHMIKVNILCIM